MVRIVLILRAILTRIFARYEFNDGQRVSRGAHEPDGVIWYHLLLLPPPASVTIACRIESTVWCGVASRSTAADRTTPRPWSCSMSPVSVSLFPGTAGCRPAKRRPLARILRWLTHLRMRKPGQFSVLCRPMITVIVCSVRVDYSPRVTTSVTDSEDAIVKYRNYKLDSQSVSCGRRGLTEKG
ncbi:hypothetical protein J6590_041325 [Homalodisca vitripennis]|nr:hypothetical protein J6590_041325 [Homalodisca vitripennis]